MPEFNVYKDLLQVRQMMAQGDLQGAAKFLRKRATDLYNSVPEVEQDTNFKILYIDYYDAIKAVEQKVHEQDLEDRIYLIRSGQQVLSAYDFLNKTGTVDRLKAKGLTLQPTHDFKLLKPARHDEFEKAREKFLYEQNLNHLKTTDFEMNCFYITWLKGELKLIEQWLSDKWPDGTAKRKPTTSTQIELLKYKQYVTDEMDRTEKLINPPKKSLPQQTERVAITDTPPKKKTYNSFHLEKTALQNIANVLDTLHDKELVDKKCKVPQFKKAFNGEGVKDKIKWIGSIAALHFFIDAICELSKNKHDRWNITIKCFYSDRVELTTDKLSNNKSVSKKDKENILTAVAHF